MLLKLVTVLLLLTLILPNASFAQSATNAAIVTNQQIPYLQHQCQSEANERLSQLQSIITLISQLKHTSINQQNTDRIFIEKLIEHLQVLQEHCLTITSTSSFNIQIKDIKNYSIFAQIVPAYDLRKIADDMASSIEDLSLFGNKLQLRIEANNQQDTTSSLLTDMQSNIRQAHSQMNSLDNLALKMLTNSGLQENGQDVLIGHTYANEGVANIQAAWLDANRIEEKLYISPFSATSNQTKNH